jgi:hypothetical protein
LPTSASAIIWPGTEGGVTRHLPDGEVMSIYDAAMKYREQGVPLIVLAGAEYGTGSSRDWAAKGTYLLGVRAVIAASYERIHRSNLVGMGVLPLQFPEGSTWQSLGLTGEEQYDIEGLDLPILLRFNGILKDRLREMHDVFRQAIDQHEYKGGYSCVYPIKVNQQRQVVEEIVYYGKQYGFGLEAGSKPELLAVVAMIDSDMPIICNGFKDAEFIEMAMLAQRIGRHVIPVVEKFTELDLILNTPSVWACGLRSGCGSSWRRAAQDAGKPPADTGRNSA